VDNYHLTTVVTCNGKVVSSGGLFQDILLSMKDRLNFSTTTISPTNGLWGWKPDPVNGTWPGMVGMLLAHETDIISGLTLTNERAKVVEYRDAIPT
jgi:hypothetical protein